MSLTGKLAIITGVSSPDGIGAAIAHNLASKGADLIISHSTASTSSAAGQSIAANLRTLFPNISVTVVQADLASATDPAKIVTAAGGRQIDIIVNNAAWASFAPVTGSTAEDFEKTYNINVRAPLFLIQAAEPYLPKDRSGRIINISSSSAAAGPALQSIYAGSKGAVEAMTRVLSRELAERATVNSVAPGITWTRVLDAAPKEFMATMRPNLEGAPLSALTEEERTGKFKDLDEWAEVLGGRPGLPEEVAGVVGMLTGADASWVTGQVVDASGGLAFHL